jgi:glycerol-3-phosphate dehydrogenase
MLAPHLTRQGLEGGFRYGDAQTDDSRLVLRVIREALLGSPGAVALNYVAVEGLLWNEGAVAGVRLRDQVTGQSAEVRACVVVNATGAWADTLRKEVGAPPRMRPLRGSHLIFPAWKLPVAQAVSFLHPVDGRPVFIFPWEGITLVGTTDVDHDEDLESEPSISPGEVAYLMAAVEYRFPGLDLSLDDVMSTFAGVRPVVASGKADPSKESRDHVVWEESGLLTVAGGKLTTFRLLALDALKAASYRLPPVNDKSGVLSPVDVELGAGQLHEGARRRLLGRYGAEAPALVAAAKADELEAVPGTQFLWAELRWAARAEGVVHLDDLLLRRVRLGHLLPEGGKEIMDRVRAICQAELGWDDKRWEAEEAAYLALWASTYSLPPRGDVPDWKAMLAEACAQRAAQPSRRRKAISLSGLAAGLLGVAAVAAWLYCRSRRR